MPRKTKKRPPVVAFDRPTRSRIAVLANCDERTVYRYLRGDGVTQRAIAAAIKGAIEQIQGA
jgi:hypothetical protein